MYQNLLKENRMKRLLIDVRIREEEYNYLSQYFKITKIPLSQDVYDEISGHSDIFYCRLNDSIICAPNAPIIEDNFIMGTSRIGRKYPQDIAYNACQIGKTIIGSKYTDKTIKPDIIVKQGYTKCSICVTGEGSCITTDKSIAKHLERKGLYVTYIQENNIKLLDRSGKPTEMKGFIGGSSLVFDNKFVLFGDINLLESKEKILDHIKICNLELVNFRGMNVNDYGGAIIY